MVTGNKQVGTAALVGPDESWGFVILSVADRFAKANPSAESKDPYPSARSDGDRGLLATLPTSVRVLMHSKVIGLLAPASS